MKQYRYRSFEKIVRCVSLGVFLLAWSCRSAPVDLRSAPDSAEPPNQLSAAERGAGWHLLFDGRSLDGWRGLGYPDIPSAHWTVQDGAIKKIANKNAKQADGKPSPGGDLMTVATYGDFELAWDWKISPAGNSGLKYNVSEELSTSEPVGSHAAIGFEYQMLDDDRHPDGRLPIHRAGALYDLIPPNAAKRLHPVGEWNHSVVVFIGNHGEHWLNGAKVVEYNLGSQPMATALAASKYARIPWFAVRRTAHVVLQDHGDEAYFRSIKIREHREPQ
jgi:hypothetical protein